jgi:hypothetical protein
MISTKDGFLGKMEVNVGSLSDEYFKQYARGSVFVESGTYQGDTVQQVLRLDLFKKIYSVELNHNLWEQSSSRFLNNENVQILEGDTFDHFKTIIRDNKKARMTFWLDGHASGPLAGGKAGGCPLLEELNDIKSSSIKTHTIFIDDRRLFGSAEWSFVKEQQVTDLINQINPEYKIEYLDGSFPNDIICAYIP